MAIDLTLAQLVAALRLGTSAAETAEATRLLAYVYQAIQREAPDAPAVISNEAAIRLAAYLYDQPTSSAGDQVANALRFSGAKGILLPYRVHRAGAVSDDDKSDDDKSGGTPAPVPSDPSAAARTGAETFLASTRYNHATGRLTFSYGTTPPEIGFGDVIVWQMPNIAVPLSPDISVNDGVHTDAILLDFDDSQVNERQLKSGRVYEIRREIATELPNTPIVYRMTVPLSVQEIQATQTATVVISNTQLKALNKTYVEVIPAPGVGKFIEVARYRLQILGADVIDYAGLTSDEQRINAWMALNVMYILTPSQPYPLGLGNNPSEVGNLLHWGFNAPLFGLCTDTDERGVVGGQSLRENHALHLGCTVGIGRRFAATYYMDDWWDGYFAGVDDKNLILEVDYFVHT